MFNFKLIDKWLNFINKNVIDYIVPPHSYFEDLGNYGSPRKLYKRVKGEEKPI